MQKKFKTFMNDLILQVQDKLSETKEKTIHSFLLKNKINSKEYNEMQLQMMEEMKQIKSQPNFLHFDFQGWPVTKKTLRELLIELGADTSNNTISFKEDDSLLDVYLETLEDDGMAYGINEMFFTSATISEDKDKNKHVYLWRDKKYEN